MLRTDNGPPTKPDIQRAVDRLLSEDSQFDRNENRSWCRENLVRSVSITIRGEEETISAFSRNISAAGIGVISNEPIAEKSTAAMTIAGLSDNDMTILAECRWCKQYGENWFLSGWQFVNLIR